MNSRIAQVRTSLGLTQAAFADKIGVSQNYVWMIEKGTRTPSDRTVSDICREFGVDKVWLETGDGEPFRPMSVRDQLAEIFGDVLSGNPTVKNKFIEAVSLLPEEAYPIIAQSILDIADRLREPEE